TMSSAARMPRWSSTPEYASVPVRSIVCRGLMRPSEGYLLFAPCGPCWSKLSASEITLPLRTRRAAATMSAAVVLLSVPISSAGPQRPQLLYFSAASARSLRVSLRDAMVLFLVDCVVVREPVRSIGLEPGLAHDLGPFRHFLPDEGGELLRRAGAHLDADRGEPVLQVGRLHDARDLRVELRDDGLRSS